jgi:hypothetical protein
VKHFSNFIAVKLLLFCFKGISRGKAKETLNCHFVDKIASCHLTEETFIIDNSVEDENIIRLRKHIFDAAARQEYWKEDIPAKWVTLENVIMKLKDEKMKVCLIYTNFLHNFYNCFNKCRTDRKISGKHFVVQSINFKLLFKLF